MGLEALVLTEGNREYHSDWPLALITGTGTDPGSHGCGRAGCEFYVHLNLLRSCETLSDLTRDALPPSPSRGLRDAGSA